jgi:hypothetical protein
MKIVSRTGSLIEDGELDFALDERADEDVASKKTDKEKTLLGECAQPRTEH